MYFSEYSENVNHLKSEKNRVKGLLQGIVSHHKVIVTMEMHKITIKLIKNKNKMEHKKVNDNSVLQVDEIKG